MHSGEDRLVNEQRRPKEGGGREEKEAYMFRVAESVPR